MSSYLFLLLVLACPLAMIFMMRGMMGGGRHDGGHEMHDRRPENTGEPPASKYTSLDELQSQRDAIDEEITKRQRDDAPRPRATART